jgi:hypothetical protein
MIFPSDVTPVTSETNLCNTTNGLNIVCNGVTPVLGGWIGGGHLDSPRNCYRVTGRAI